MRNSGSRIQKTIRNTEMGLLTQFCSLILNFALRTVFIYTLGIQYTGISSVFSDILTMLSLSELGIGTAIATALYKPLHDHDQAKIRKLMLFYKQAYRLIAFLILIMGIILIPFLNYFINDIPDIEENIRIIFLFYIIKTAASYLLIYKATLLNADQKQYVVKLLEIICSIIRYTTEIVLLLLFQQYMFYLIIEVVAIIVQNYIISKQVEKQYPFAFTRTIEHLSDTEKKALYKDIKGLAMFRLSGAVGNSIDNILISSFISTVFAGMFSNYILIRRQLESIMHQFFNAVTPSIGSLVAENDSEKQYVVFKRMLFICFTVVNFCATSYFIMINPFIGIWIGDSFLLDKAIAFITAFDFFIYILLQLIASFRTANGIFVKGQYRPLITTILNVILSIILIQNYGIFGTILATVICRLVTQWYDPYLLCKYVFKKSFGKFYFIYWCYIALFLGCCTITYNISELLHIQSKMLNFLWKLGCCIIIPNVIVVILTGRSNELHYTIGLCINKLKKFRKQKQ